MALESNVSTSCGDLIPKYYYKSFVHLTIFAFFRGQILITPEKTQHDIARDYLQEFNVESDVRYIVKIYGAMCRERLTSKTKKVQLLELT